MSETVLIALGGNALVQQSEAGRFDQQIANASRIADVVVDMVTDGTEIVVTHGNGPQVGNIMLQNDANEGQSMPLFACSAESQGLIGAALTLAFDSAFQRQDMGACTVTMLTPVVVDDEPGESTKPVGPFYTESEVSHRTGQYREDAGRGWRRIVPSPNPVDIRCTEQIEQIIARGDVPVVAGGGGLPVRPTEDGYEYVDGVIDKDLAASLLADQVDADRFVILTDVPNVCLHYGTSEERALDHLDLNTARTYQSEGHFERGSMYEKVEAICRYLECDSSGEGVIASLDEVERAIAGQAGTKFEAAASPPSGRASTDSDVET